MSNMVNIKGKQVSEDTAELALQEYFKSHPEEYQFRAGDVCREVHGGIRIIHQPLDKPLASICINGGFQSIRGQKDFVTASYKKIGVLSDYFDHHGE